MPTAVTTTKDLFIAAVQQEPLVESTGLELTSASPRAAWVEIDLKKLRRNFELIGRDKSARLCTNHAGRRQILSTGSIATRTGLRGVLQNFMSGMPVRVSLF